MPDSSEKTRIGAHLWAGFHGTTADEQLKEFIREFRIGGAVLFRRNVESAEQLQALVNQAGAYAREQLGRPLLFSIDQEGGPVQRLAPPYERLPAARELAARGEELLVETVRRAARELLELGVRVNLAPVLDVAASEDDHFMGARTLSDDPGRAAELGRLWIRTLQENGVAATAKHFPGLRLARSDPHHYAPVIRWPSADAMEQDLEPFRGAIEAGARLFMTSHALYPDLDPDWPATLSVAVNRTLLRDRLGFAGVLLSDDLDMAAVHGCYSPETIVRRGLLASVDGFLVCQSPERVEDYFRAFCEAAASDGEAAAAHEESLKRLERLLEYAARGSGPFSSRF